MDQADDDLSSIMRRLSLINPMEPSTSAAALMNLKRSQAEELRKYSLAYGVEVSHDIGRHLAKQKHDSGDPEQHCLEERLYKRTDLAKGTPGSTYANGPAN